MKEFWDIRYSNEVYAYGTKPNEFLRIQLEDSSPGNILFPAEGEGRNAVYAASKGFDVFAFDYSVAGRKKALDLAHSFGVSIQYEISTFEDCSYPEGSFDFIALIFTHMPAGKRKEWHSKLISFLKPGGMIILQGFAKEQISKNSGGPKDLTMLFSKDELLDDFRVLNCEFIQQEMTLLNEGEFHQGEASVINAIFIKPQKKD